MIKNFLLRTWAILIIASKRLRAQVGLSMATAVGLVTLIALVMSIPAYADAVAYRILSANLIAGYPDRVVSDSNRSPFTFMFQYKGPFRGATQWEQAIGVDKYLSNQAGAELGLPVKLKVRYLKTFPFKLYAPADVGVRARLDAFRWTSFFALSDVQSHIKIIEGSFPAVAQPSATSTVEVLVSDTLANIMGLSVGDIYTAYNTSTDATTNIPVKIAGIWQAIDLAAPYWFYQPKDMYQDLLVPEATYFQRLAPNTPDELGEAVWYLALDSSSVHSGDVAAFISRITQVDKKARDLMNGMYLKESPKDMLLQYQSTTNLLIFLLTAFSIPIAALILAFISLVSSVIIERQRNEIAVLRSRGATGLQIAAISAIEGLLLVAVAVLAGIPASKAIIYLMGKTRSFLDFSLPASLPPHSLPTPRW